MDLLQQLQDDIFRRIDANSMFAHVATYKRAAPEDEEKAGIEELINDAVNGIATRNGKSGMGCVVFVPEVGVSDSQTPGPEISITCTVAITENFLSNRHRSGGTGKTAGQLAVFLLQLFDQYSPRPGWIIRPDMRDAIKPVPVEGGLGFDVLLKIPALNLAPQPRCAVPLITVGGSTTTITSTESGVALHFTTDGSLPTRESPLYTSAIPNLPTGEELRAIAAKVGYLDSSGALKTY